MSDTDTLNLWHAQHLKGTLLIRFHFRATLRPESQCSSSQILQLPDELLSSAR